MADKQNVDRIKESVTAQLPRIELRETEYPRIPFSWSIRDFGRESLKTSISRLAAADIALVELQGNRFTSDIGYDVPEVKKVLSDANIEVSGICGIFSPECCLSAENPSVRQNAMDYIKRNLDLAVELKADYFVIVPGAPGRSDSEDEYEFERAVETLQKIEYLFEDSSVRGAIEPLRMEDVSFCNTIADARDFIRALDSTGIRQISAHAFHLLFEEKTIFENLRENAEKIINLHICDSNRLALGRGILDLDLLISALYAGGFRGYVNAQPVLPGHSIYSMEKSAHSPALLEEMVEQTFETWKSREKAVQAAIRNKTE